ncbi:winged helix-turn-helix domain-containing protein [Gimibacter soli]|uniref:Response regulator transcription factor n=1 Tax=Gimibacter soli TaxID=3024400 RepID=A0AAE9XU14_9PROT|nr:response regulator transcription factor [Gimibacter soli]WCL55285.1 response regulator transcription factor [Gimibacter soli]
MQILLVEDDNRVADHVVKGLREAGHMIERVADGKKALYMTAAESYDVIILDRMLPNVDGLTILKTMRAAEDNTPVLLLSALGEVDDRVKGLRAGADDYLAKPFSFSELLARVEVLARRGPVTVEKTTLTVMDLSIDLLAHEVVRDGKRIDLTTREFRILEYLARNMGRVVTRSMLLEKVWDYHFDPQTNIIDQHVSRLRQKVDKGFAEQLIHTVRGTGYMIRPPV